MKRQQMFSPITKNITTISAAWRKVIYYLCLKPIMKPYKQKKQTNDFMRSTIFTAFSFLFSLISYSQVNIKDDLKKLNIYEYYHKTETDSLLLNPDEVNISPFSTDNINPNFSNLNNPAWLSNIPKDNKVLLIGESHYSTLIHNIRNHIIFSINKTNYYPLIIFEQQYSITPFVNYYLSLKDDVKAKNFFSSTLTNFVDTKGDSTLYELLRNWNKQNPDKMIEVGFSDLEFNADLTYDKILKPYFLNLHLNSSKIDSIFNLKPDDLFSTLESLVKKAEKEKLVGDFPFIDNKYIKNVISNLKYTSDFFNLNRSQLGIYYRQKGIIHNLTNENVFGKKLKNSKVIIYCGGFHATNRVEYPDGGNIFREGSYLTYDYKKTKGKTYSIMIEGLAYNLGEMSRISLDNKFSGSQYKDIATRLKKAYDQKLIDSDKPYFAFDDKNDFFKMIAHFGFKYKTNAFLLNSCNWGKLINDPKSTNTDLQYLIEYYKKKINQYDKYIYINYSPIEVLREKIK